MRSYLLALVAAAALACSADAAETRYPEDAALHAVQFLDADVGYAVGDEGVIWKTIDGGKTWDLMPSGVRGSLRSVHMLTPLAGWVVGREELAHGAGSAGIVLNTQDGGESWRRLYADSIPGLNHVRFGDADTGYMVGDGTDQYPTGVFVTSDGGRHWRPVNGPRCTTWLGCDFLDGKNAALAGAWSRLGVLRNGQLSKADVDSFGGRNVNSLQLRSPKSFAVGQGGLVLESRSQDSKSESVGWGSTDTKLPPDVLKSWDFNAVCCIGNKVWIVGRPGSAVLHSDDLGVNWKVSKTGQTLPLNAVHFFDSNRGWAVGEFGCILATSDGGKTWAVQRRGGQRAAVLCVHARAEGLPVDTVAMLGAEQGLLAAVLRVAAADFKSDLFAESAQPQRLAGAHRTAGGAAAETLWQFPAPQHFAGADKIEVMKHWDRLHGDQAANELLRQLVLALRMWQPDLVLGDDPDFKTTGNAASALIAEALHEAFKQAADPKAFPEQIEQLDLKPWRVTRYYGIWDKRNGSHVSVDNTREVRRNCRLPMPSTRPSPPGLAGRDAAGVADGAIFRMLATTQTGDPKNLLDGVNFGPLGVSRRNVTPVDELNPKLAAAVKSQRQLLTLAKNPIAGLAESPQLLGQMGGLLARLPEDRAAKAGCAIAGEFARQGQWDLARDAYMEIITRYPLHPMAVDACRWLIRFNSSSEARRRKELGQFLVAPVTPPKGALVPSPNADPKLAGAPKINPPVKIGPEMTQEQLEALAKELKSNSVTHAGYFFSDPAELLHWYKGSLLLGKQLAGFGKLYAGDPSIQFCLQSSNRKLGDFKSAYQFYSTYCGEYAEGPWRETAAQELWYANRVGLPPRPLAVCRETNAKPYLDGNFDDACWKGQKPMVLRDAVQQTAKEYPTEAMLSFDGQFLYIALTCKHPIGRSVPAAQG